MLGFACKLPAAWQPPLTSNQKQAQHRLVKVQVMCIQALLPYVKGDYETNDRALDEHTTTTFTSLSYCKMKVMLSTIILL